MYFAASMYSAASQLLYRVSGGHFGTPANVVQAPVRNYVEQRTQEVAVQSLGSREEETKHDEVPVVQRSISVVDEVDDKGNTKLHRAILFRQQVNIHPKDVLESTVTEIIMLLQRGVNPTVQNQEGDTVLHLVSKLPYWGSEHDTLVKTLLKYGAKANVANTQGETAFHRIVSAKGSSSIVETLITDGLADVNAQDRKGDTALHRAARSDQSFGSSFNAVVAYVLLKHNAKVDMPNHEGDTPLHVAVKSNKSIKEAAQFFIDAHANINAQNLYGDTPLHLLASYNQWDKWDHQETIELFLRQGADKTLQNKQGELPIHKAYKRSGNSKAITLLQEGVYLETPDYAGHTILHLAAMDSDRNIDEFRRVLKKSKDIMIADKSGNTALHYAASNGFYDAVELLIADKATVDILNKDGNSPLFLAVWSLLRESYREISSDSHLKGMKEIITVLRSAKKDPTEKVRFEIEPQFSKLHYNALRRIINLLLDNGSKNVDSSIEYCFSWGKMFSTFNTSEYFRNI